MAANYGLLGQNRVAYAISRYGSPVSVFRPSTGVTTTFNVFLQPLDLEKTAQFVSDGTLNADDGLPTLIVCTGTTDISVDDEVTASLTTAPGVTITNTYKISRVVPTTLQGYVIKQNAIGTLN